MPADLSLLADVPILQLLDDDERATLASLLDQRQCAAGSTIFHEGEPGDALFLVTSGEVEVAVTSDTGDHIVLAHNERGATSSGEISLLDGGPRSATAKALTDVELLILSRAHLFELVVKRPHVAIDLLTVMGRRLRATDELLRTRVSRNANEEIEEANDVRSAHRRSRGEFRRIVDVHPLVRRRFDRLGDREHRHSHEQVRSIRIPTFCSTSFSSMLAALQAPVIMMNVRTASR